MKENGKTFKIIFIAVMAAFSTVIYMLFPEIPLVPGVDYLKIDLSDIPAILAGLTAGPFSGFCVEILKNIIHLSRTTTVGIGEIMNIGMGAAIIYSMYFFEKLFIRVFKKEKMSPKVYYCSAVITVAVSIFAGWILNLVFTPVYFKIAGIPLTSATLFAGVWGSTLLNAIKAAINLLPFYAVYYPVYKVFQKYS